MVLPCALLFTVLAIKAAASPSRISALGFFDDMDNHLSVGTEGLATSKKQRLLLRSEADSLAEIDPAPAADEDPVCTEPPCCPDSECVFPFESDGKTYTECTKDGQEAFWCSKEAVYGEKSHWAACDQMPESGKCPVDEGDAVGASADSSAVLPLASFNETSGCKAPPSGQHKAAAPACVEGESLEDGEWCTPSCQLGTMSFVNVSGVKMPDECARSGSGNESDPLWGAKLCCSGGQLHPPWFFCVRDIFTLMDADHNGTVNRSEFDAFRTEGAGHEHAADVRRLGAERIRKKMKELEDAKPAEETNAFVYYYILIVSVLLAIGAVLMLVRVFQAATAPPKPSPSIPLAAPSPAGDPAGESAVVGEAVDSNENDDQGPNELELSFSGNVYDETLIGKYVKEAEQANGYPVWKKDEVYLFSDLEGQWVFGSAEEKAQNFESPPTPDNQLIRCKHGGEMPHLMADLGHDEKGWHRADEEIVGLTLVVSPA